MFAVRGVRSPQGPVKLVKEREAYFALVAQGMSNRRACAVVGVNPKTGLRWRYGRSGQAGGKRVSSSAAVPPAVVAGRVGSSRFLSVEERIYIADRWREKASMRAIGRELGRSVSTISRELRRNAHPVSGDYRPHAAQARAQTRRPRPKIGKIAGNRELRGLVQAMLDDKFSPQQISARLRRDYPDRPELHVVHETIYQALYVQGRGELRRELTRALRTGRAVRKPRRGGEQRQPRFTAPMIMISDRPAEAEDRAVPGHWEGDLIIGKDHASAIGTLVERSTRYVMLVHLGHNRSAEAVRDGLITAISTLPAHLKKSLTWDQGAEMARHHEFSLATTMPVYFCDPRSPWQRGTNENTNGLLRQYFPKGTDLSIHSPRHLADVAAQLNRRPRKTLDWDTPAQRLTTLLTNTT